MRRAFARAAQWASGALGSPIFFLSQVALTAVWLGAWLATGRSDSLQIAFTTFLTVTTWLLLILLQHSQNADTKAIQAKLDEMVRALPQADDKLIGVEREEE